MEKSSKRKKPVKREIAEYRKTPKKGWQPPSWVSVIPQGSHGKTIIQKKLWKLTSDYVRIKDFYLYPPVCVGCGTVFSHWKDGQACHWKAWASCDSYAKYDTRNLILACGGCNRKSDGPINDNFKDEISDRIGEDIKYLIEERCNYFRGQKLDNIVMVQMMEATLDAIGKLPEQPEYYDKVLAKKNAL